MTKYALIGLLAVCATVLCFSLIFRERLCELNIHRGNTVVQVEPPRVSWRVFYL
ncbi:Hok/Gef family protein (plasmid) [Escherichia coli O78:H51]|uniref:Hok/Gef family protein n=1 Tax=Escherichia coli TaxID=562 RepID=UPI00259C6B46|nr:Hok/Gef family protein [Escherichia coli]WJL54191.1 Hok/Gef family protein [Escherichia coli O78:H51]WJL59094.1 Hok/Gef family protein [Escherichia coli O78:H51]